MKRIEEDRIIIYNPKKNVWPLTAFACIVNSISCPTVKNCPNTTIEVKRLRALINFELAKNHGYVAAHYLGDA